MADNKTIEWIDKWLQKIDSLNTFSDDLKVRIKTELVKARTTGQITRSLYEEIDGLVKNENKNKNL